MIGEILTMTIRKKLLEFVRKKFSFPTRGDAFVKRSLGKKWKDYKCDLNSIYMKKYKTKDVLLKNKPSRIPRDQWIGLVSYWVSDKAKKRSQSNRRNRAKQKMPYTGGSKSIATLMDEKTVDGREPTRAEAFILTHAPRKDGRPIDEESANAIRKTIWRTFDKERRLLGSVSLLRIEIQIRVPVSPVARPEDFLLISGEPTIFIPWWRTFQLFNFRYLSFRHSGYFIRYFLS